MEDKEKISNLAERLVELEKLLSHFSLRSYKDEYQCLILDLDTIDVKLKTFKTRIKLLEEERVSKFKKLQSKILNDFPKFQFIGNPSVCSPYSTSEDKVDENIEMLKKILM